MNGFKNNHKKRNRNGSFFFGNENGIRIFGFGKIADSFKMINESKMELTRFGFYYKKAKNIFRQKILSTGTVLKQLVLIVQRK